MNNLPASVIKTRQATAGGPVKWIRRTLIILCIAGAILTGLLQISAPKPADSNVSPEEFSSSRAMKYLENIAREPHPLGSAAHDRVRDYLLSELKLLGLLPEVHESKVMLYNGQNVFVENIVTRIPGSDNSKPVMIAAHYDSVPDGPGAADDGAAIAAMLETVHALQASGTMKNDLILLMTDGEELGLAGARAFMNSHPWAKEPGLVLNFEARGNRGPSFMFETSDLNGWLIQEFTKAAPYPIGYSLIYNVYKLMPNDTDLTEFKAGGLAGLNFAFGMGVNAYHDEIDTPENLDESSLQHHGEYMLSLTRHFGNLDLTQVKQEDEIYFNVFGWNMVHYPQSWAGWLLGVAILLFVLTIGHGLYARRITLKGMAAGFVLLVLLLGAVYGMSKLAWNLVQNSVSREQLRVIGLDPQISLYWFIGFLAVTLGIVYLLVRWGSRYIRAENIWSGTMLLWLLLSAGTCFYLPGGSYLFVWPLIFSLVGLNVSVFVREGSTGWSSALFAMPGLILFSPICYLVFVLMTIMMAGELMVMATLAFSLVFPACCTVEQRRKGRSAIKKRFP
ncbi:M20/M25/M40 family metallo-hydrolase [Fontibacillus sp. BL9]|uniref:M20/M25/M40 family metallo-hydrolase n=1 Tax=Fontibacillus sp. BL9 TaxID=3389971 RepID=UPI00397D0467